MTPPRDDSAKTGRRAELLHLAADLFASRGVRATTVRDIADAAGILSGSLYHHFDSKESMVDEILRGFLDDLFDRYRKIVAAGSIPARRSKRSSPRPTNRSTDRTLRSRSTRTRPSISTATGSLHRRTQHRIPHTVVGVLERGISEGSFRPDVDVDVVFRFLRDTVWVAVRWYRPGGALSVEQVAQQYLSIVLDGLSNPNPA